MLPLFLLIFHENLIKVIYYICRISLPVYQAKNCKNIHNQTEENQDFSEICHQNKTDPSQQKGVCWKDTMSMMLSGWSSVV